MNMYRVLSDVYLLYLLNVFYVFSFQDLFELSQIESGDKSEDEEYLPGIRRCV